LLVAGKGHEDYQIVGDRRLQFDDRQVLREEVHGVGG
jgi:UDP-N-acetylmuramoyl-L-alanyl-D-glutamate--2,6-diaminopimelate ligase